VFVYTYIYIYRERERERKKERERERERRGTAHGRQTGRQDPVGLREERVSPRV
jgi:hypothetical protein